MFTYQILDVLQNDQQWTHFPLRPFIVFVTNSGMIFVALSWTRSLFLDGGLESTASAVVDEAIKTAEQQEQEVAKKVDEPTAAPIATPEKKLEPEETKEHAEGEVVEAVEEVIDEEPEILVDCESAVSSVHCLLFADTFVEMATRAPVLLVGTRGGLAMVHRLSWPADEGSLTTNLVKEMQLKHAAPILGMLVLDAKLKGSRSVPDPVNNRSRYFRFRFL